jgi:hypothetical protein
MKETMLSALSKIGTGVLYGIGFGLSVSMMFYVVDIGMKSLSIDDRIADTVIVTKSEETKLPDTDFILGTVENHGARPQRFVRIAADLYDKQGKFVYQYNERLPGTLNPGESRNFKVECSCAKGKMPKEHETYKLVVTGS